MDTVYGILVVLHLLGWAMVFGGVLAGMKGVTLNPGAFHGVLTALVTGILLVGLASSGVAGHEPDNAKIAVKLVVALAVTAMIVVGRRRPELVTRGYLGGIVGLTALNVAIAVLWR
ncbi:hypothetical protein J1G42_07250 [Cellulomonas sp. zg-ZUI222]|uniref:Integral membrane protein n=1 Tax=Cellulomonas wangleii TaxID=2816956 RepID=A0ABX8D1L6_9CELL|nr:MULTISPECIES: hypothetical protein [Cellulomonas]MBO0899758.1 hypothetical protein [Cellulomonas sp. zg-ZUI22]MBO0920620.1 hypothetical protein [Cellulomonas wangleii]MBO0922962.1 hypothetical protein [Cellulomonas wangleii]QVI61354.1 hypothetical protein KG103_12790 [Cellulomonas wangleii]